MVSCFEKLNDNTMFVFLEANCIFRDKGWGFHNTVHFFSLVPLIIIFKLTDPSFPPQTSILAALRLENTVLFHIAWQHHIYIMSLLVVPTLHWNYIMLTLHELFKPLCFHGCTITSVGKFQAVMWVYAHFSFYTHFPTVSSDMFYISRVLKTLTSS